MKEKLLKRVPLLRLMDLKIDYAFKQLFGSDGTIFLPVGCCYLEWHRLLNAGFDVEMVAKVTELDLETLHKIQLEREIK